jgi:EAL domain-containing protein (putative c-di-GMP-specific phosphodiesterase class I)
VLEETGLPPQFLKLEVTESGLMEQPEEAAAKMKALRKKGIHFLIDDFGIGYSSLGYLKQLPIDTLKIDRSFVMDAATDKDDQEIIKTIIAMARNLSLNTVAEGVETKEQQEFLTRQGCQMMQGYYFGRPMPAEQFEQILSHEQNLRAS